MPQLTFEQKKYLLSFLALMIFWFFVYSLGKHPDVPWGDGLGYAMAIENGFDLATNANSHYLYLNFHRLLMLAFQFKDPVFLLGWASVGWALICIFFTFKISSVWSGNTSAFISATLLASSFPFWRHACIPEVYTMELAFWACQFLLIYYWTERQNKLARNVLFFVHALSLLVHIHFILFFPVLFIICLVRKEWPFVAWLGYFIPVLVVVLSVFSLETNTISQVFFENVQDKMLSFNWKDKLKGPFYTLFLLLAMFPFGIGLLVFGCWKDRTIVAGSLFARILIGSVIPLAGFAALFPEPGIYVFLLPVILVISLFSGRIMSRYTESLKAIAGILIFQLLFFYSEKQLFDSFAKSNSIARQEIKGGTGFLFLPWAKGNVASVLEKMNRIPLDSFPENEQWNARQAIEWNENHPDYIFRNR